MKFSRFYLVSLVFLLLHFLFVSQGGNSHKLTDELSTVNSGKLNLGKGKCDKENAACKEDSQENVFENEDYIYTQSLP
ncbi:Hypothetical predicted protein [Olea europaea subsp. europaea]|uniref:Phytosulfokine-beta n=1 Tax=Olea europaea subsp. europaea TaxID=158383 RepID=A0A8S0SMJ7_OLEEU|nr:Hypothetical predicted protein [Olea europaea subsp. europaea]